MKILVTLSNWKRTGPVEPALDGAKALSDAGHEVVVATGRAPADLHENIADDARGAAIARGLNHLDLGLTLHKHSSPFRNFRDVRRLRRYLNTHAPDVVVSTLKNDHQIVARAREWSSATKHVALWFADGLHAPASPVARAFRKASAVAAFSRDAAHQLRQLGVTNVVHTGVPLDSPSLRNAVRSDLDVRAAYEIPDDAMLFGIVARMQRHRRFELLWDAAAKLRDDGLLFRLLVLGRGTYQEEVGFTPVKQRGLESHVIFAGYKRGAVYASTVSALDVQLFLVPGSDPTNRALREGMTLGVPSLTTRRGMLPELVQDGKTGWLFDETADALAHSMRRCIQNRSEVDTFGTAAKAHASEAFSSSTFARDLLAATER